MSPCAKVVAAVFGVPGTECWDWVGRALAYATLLRLRLLSCCSDARQAELISITDFVAVFLLVLILFLRYPVAVCA